MGLESRRRNISILILSKRPLVDDSVVSGFVEYAGCDPRLHVDETRCVSMHHTQQEDPPKKTYLEHQPSPKAYSADLLRPI
jgi:hypothetical protein